MAEINAITAPDIISKYILRDVLPFVVDLEKSKGNRIFDAHSNRFLLDCFSYVASNPIGHNHPALFDPAFERKLLRVARTKPSNSDFFTVELAEFVEVFARVAMPAELQHLFLVEGGAVAVENAMKTAFDWKVRKNFARGEKTERGYKIIHFTEAFHGRTGYTLPTTNTADSRKTKFFPKFDWPRIENPKLQFPLTPERIADAAGREQAAISKIRAILEKEERDIAAIIIEPIQSEGGDNHFRPEFHQALRKLADQFDVLLIYDEVQTGVGLTGRMWAYQHYGVVPDIVSFGKKMQVCGILAGKTIDKVKDNVFEEASRINSTWGGNLVDIVRAAKYLEVIDSEKLVENAATVGKTLLGALRGLEDKFSGFFSGARGLGLLCSIDVPDSATRDKMITDIYERGAILLKCGPRSLRFRPSLTFSQNEVGEMIDILSASAKAMIK